METLEVIIGGVLVVSVAAIHILEGLHLMEMIKTKWPRFNAFLVSRSLSFSLAIVGIGLLCVAMTQLWHEAPPKSAPAPKPPTSEQQPGQKIDQKATDSNCSNVIAGRDAKVDCSPGAENKDAKKHPPKNP